MARKPILQRISLEGGDVIAKQLKQLGDIGERAFAQIEHAAIKADLAKFGTSLKTFGSDLATVGKRLSLAFAGIGTAVGAAAVGITALTKSSADVVDQQAAVAEGLGLTIEQLGELQFAAKLSGNSLDVLEPSLAKLSATLGEAQAGTKEAVKKFSDLGVSLKRSDGTFKSTFDVFLDIADALSKLPDGAHKSALASALLGKTFAQLIPLLDEGRKGLLGLFDQAKRAGVVFSVADSAIANNLNDSLDAMGKSVLGLRVKLGLLFAPVLTAAVQTFTEFIDRNRAALVELGRVVVQVGVSFLRDFVNALTGRDAAVTRKWILDLRDGIIQFGRDVTAVITGVVLPLFRTVRAAADLVAQSLNKMFGTDVTGGQVLLAAGLLQLLGVFRLLGSTIAVVVSGVTLLGSVFAALPLATIGGFFAALVTGALDFLGLIGLLVGWPALIVAAIIAAGAAIFVFWDEIKAGAQIAYDFLASLFTAENAAAIFADLVAAGASVWDLITAAWTESQDAIVSAFNDIVTALNDAWATGIAAIADTAKELWDGIVSAFEDAKNRVVGIWDSAVSTIKTGVADATGFIGRLVDRIGSAISALKELVGLQGSVGQTSVSRTPRLAGGGSVRGPGSSTSDSIPAWLSSGEFVMSAKAVRQYGVAFMAAINGLKLPAGGLFPGLSLGGLADSLTHGMRIPRFAAGGFADFARASAGPLTPIHLHMPSGDVINILAAAPINVLGEFNAAVARANTNSTGRPASWRSTGAWNR